MSASRASPQVAVDQPRRAVRGWLAGGGSACSPIAVPATARARASRRPGWLHGAPRKGALETVTFGRPAESRLPPQQFWFGVEHPAARTTRPVHRLIDLGRCARPAVPFPPRWASRTSRRRQPLLRDPLEQRSRSVEVRRPEAFRETRRRERAASASWQIRSTDATPAARIRPAVRSRHDLEPRERSRITRPVFTRASRERENFPR